MDEKQFINREKYKEEFKARIFCHNPKCHYHIECEPNQSAIMVERISTKVTTTLHRMQYPIPGNKIFLCEICANVLQMIKAAQDKMVIKPI